MTSSSSIGRRIVEAREARDWTQVDLARRSGVSASYISRLEDGYYKRPSHEKLSALASALGRTVADLAEPPAPSDEDADAQLRRLVERRVGPENAYLVDGIMRELERRGRPVDPEPVLRIVITLLDTLPPAP